MENPSSPLDTLRQLKEMLDAGALTPTEFEALKQRLLFSNTTLSTPPASTEPPPPVAPPVPVVLAPAPAFSGPAEPTQPPVAPGLPTTSFPQAAPPEGLPSVPPAWVDSAAAYTQPITVTKVSVAPTDAGTPPAPPTPSFTPDFAAPPAEVPPVVPAPVAPPSRPSQLPFSAGQTVPPTNPYSAPESYAPAPQPVAEPDEFDGIDQPVPAKKSSLGLILALGGLLAFLGVVAYLSFNPRPSERLTSTSQTTADSVVATIETGPQAEQTPFPVAAPETIRVRPANPAPVVQPRPAAPARDSAALLPAPAASPVPTDSATNP